MPRRVPSMARRAATSAYSASDLQKAVEVTRANVTVTDSLSSDEEAPTETAETAKKTGKRTRSRKSGAGKDGDKTTAPEQDAEVTSHVRSTAGAPSQERPAEAVTMAELLPLLNGNGTSTNSTSDQLDDEDDAADLAQGPAERAAAASASAGAIAAEGNQARHDTATPTPLQQSPAKKKRGRPSKADIAEREVVVRTNGVTDAAKVPPSTSNTSALPATSVKKRKRLSKARRETSTPAVEVKDSLFTTQDETDAATQDEEQAPLFRSPSVESESPPPASNPRPRSSKRKRPDEEIEKLFKQAQTKKQVRPTAKDKGKARAVSPELAEEEAVATEDAESSTTEEDEVQKSLVQDLPQRKSARKPKANGAAVSKKPKASAGKAPVGGETSAAASPTKKAAKTKKTAPVGTPAASGPATHTNSQTPVASGGREVAPGSTASRPQWIRNRLRKLSAQQHKNLLAHRTRPPNRAKGNAWSEEEEITLILALNDIAEGITTMATQSSEDVTKNQYKRWRFIQEQHGAHGSLSDILRYIRLEPYRVLPPTEA